MAKQHITAQDNFIWLLGALILLLFFGAITEHYLGPAASRLVNLGITLTLLVAVWSLYGSRSYRIGRLGISLVLVTVAIGDIFLEFAELDTLNLSLILVFLLLSIAVAGRQVLLSGEVNTNVIVGAIALYLLMGLAWAMAYLLVDQMTPGSLNGLPAGDWQTKMQTAIYFSFVTLSTLGYGDITPALPLTRFLAYMEAITGQFYIAVLVASLVGINVSRGFRQRQNS